MNIKPKLVSTGKHSFHSQWISPIVSNWFDLVEYNPSAVYHSTDCWYTDNVDNVAAAWRESGRPVVVDRLWESVGDYSNALVLKNSAWFWYQESLWYRHLGYHTYQPQTEWTHRALMPMRLQKTHRDFLIELLGSDINKFIWSYQAKGRSLPNDKDANDWDSQRYFNSDWYNATAFSLVAETGMMSTTPFVTEKTFKPIAFRHPFIIAGDINTLKYLQELGFETFDNLFDESYDSITPWQDRCRAVVNTALSQSLEPYSRLTQQKLEHNCNHFFNQQLVTQCITKEIIEPILEYAET